MLVKRVWIDQLGSDPVDDTATGGNVDVMVEMENGEMWTAHFVTIPYLQQQLEMSKAVAEGQNELGGVGFIALETPHVVVERLTRDAIEDIVDNLMVLGNFETVFDLLIDTPDVVDEMEDS